MKLAHALIFSALMLLVGCTHEQSYRLLIRNESPDPITVGLVKIGGPFDPAWASPERLAISTSPQGGADDKWGTVVPPGRLTDSGTLTSTFEHHGLAVLRVYHGDLTLDELCARSRADTDRLDIVLEPGRSDFIVHYREGKLGAVQIAIPGQTPAPQ